MKLRLFFSAVIVAAMCPFASCDQQPQATQGTSPGSPAADSATAPGASITAAPNPVPTQGGMGTTKITWNTGGAGPGAVYIWIEEGTESRFAEGADGTKEATWIQPGKTYEFRLYTDVDRKTLLTTVKVTGK